MMMSPFNYYEEYVKNKNEQQLKSLIKRLRAQIRKLEKDTAEGVPFLYKPGPDVELSMEREYLEVAQAALVLKKYGIL